MEDSDNIIGDLFKSGVILFIGTAIGTMGTFLARTVSARFLTADTYGALALGLSIVTALASIVLLGLDQGLGRYLPRNERMDDQRRLLLAAFTTSIPVAFLAAGTLVLFGPTIANVFSDDVLTGRIFRLLGFALPFIVIMKLCIGGIQGLEHSFPKTLVQDFTIPVTRLGFLALVIYFGSNAIGITTAFVLSFFVGAVAGGYFLLRYSPISRLSEVQLKGLNTQRRRLLSFSIPLTIMGLMSIVFSNIDTLMVGYFSTTANVGIYDVSYLLSNFLVVILGSFLFLFMPIFSKLHSEGREDKMDDVYTLVTKWVLIITLPLLLVFVAFPETVIGITFGEKYVPGSLVLVVLSFGFFSNVMTGPNGNALIALGETRFIMLVNAFVAIVNFGLNLILIPRFSILGAAVATAVSYTLLNSLSSLELFSETGIHPVSLSAVKLIVGSVLALVVTYNLVPRLGRGYYVWSMFVVLSFSVVYPLVVLSLVEFTEEEIEIVGQVETRVKTDLELLKKLMR